MRRIFCGTVLVLLLISMLTLTFDIQPVKSTWTGTVYIRADGSIDPPDAAITTYDYVTYRLTDNISSTADGIVVERDNIIIVGEGYTVEGTGAHPYGGIDLSNRVNVTIQNINIQSFWYGIYLNYSSNNSISENNITANNGYGICLYSSYNNSILRNNIANNDYGIYLDVSYNNSISGNSITVNKWYGIWLRYSSNNNISENVFTNDGLFVCRSHDNVVEDNLVNGKPLVYLEGMSNLKVEDAGQVILVNCDGIILQNLNLTHTDIAIQLWNTDDTRITNNNVMNNFNGIMLSESSGNSIISNNIEENAAGGIKLWSSSNNNSVVENNLKYNSDGVMVGSSSNNNILSKNNVIANNRYGIWIGYSSNSIILKNNITNNHYGIELRESSNNLILENNIASNKYGINFGLNSSSNSIYHNNFLDNNILQVYTPDSVNIWDDGYPSGGNYWSDYADVDLYSGPFQNETGSDGIGDMPYVIDGDNADRYPLMKPYPWDPHDISITSVKTSKTVVGQGYNLSINVMLFNYGNNTENFNVTVHANTTVIGTFENITLTSRNSTTITLTLNTTGLAYGNYTIWAYAEPVPGETDTPDNTFTYGIITVTILGDVDGDFDVDIYDVVKITSIYGFNKNDPQFNPNSDLDDDGTITIYDVVRCTSHYGDTYP